MGEVHVEKRPWAKPLAKPSYVQFYWYRGDKPIPIQRFQLTFCEMSLVLFSRRRGLPDKKALGSTPASNRPPMPVRYDADSGSRIKKHIYNQIGIYSCGRTMER